mmetsp:Transcript_49782/g.91900  ORF Transcript_49782/g.91900 Transcript_49782/m.91900 type:complete len:88 (-) Transcript_49782:257-520(-)
MGHLYKHSTHHSHGRYPMAPAPRARSGSSILVLSTPSSVLAWVSLFLFFFFSGYFAVLGCIDCSLLHAKIHTSVLADEEKGRSTPFL